MDRPRSILKFERCYLAALAVGMVNAALNWERYLSTAPVQQANAMFGSWYLPFTVGLGFLIPMVLWYFVARAGSIVAKWIVVVFAVIGLLGQIAGLFMGTYVSSISAVLGLVALVLNLIAASLLFRPDARAWFDEAPETMA